jgi:endonuclease YncB( thermonuclease family)
VIDGDTIRVDGLDASLRLLGLDTEETFKYKAEWAEFDKGWAVYLAEAQAKTKSPVKIPTPMGEEAKKFAQKFFDGVRIVHLERDHPKEIRDFYNRYLTYVFVEKDGKRLNYNVECVRAGMSPYFSKYGYSRRFHDEFVAAQAEARGASAASGTPRSSTTPTTTAASSGGTAAPTTSRRSSATPPSTRTTSSSPTGTRSPGCEDLLGREVVVLGSVGDIRKGATGPTRVMLSRRRTASFPLIFFDEDVLKRSGVEAAKGEYIRAHGIVASYKNKYTGKDALQIVVTIPEQVEIEAPPRPSPSPPSPPRPRCPPSPARRRHRPSSPRKPRLHLRPRSRPIRQPPRCPVPRRCPRRAPPIERG